MCFFVAAFLPPLLPQNSFALLGSCCFPQSWAVYSCVQVISAVPPSVREDPFPPLPSVYSPRPSVRWSVCSFSFPLSIRPSVRAFRIRAVIPFVGPCVHISRCAPVRRFVPSDSIPLYSRPLVRVFRKSHIILSVGLCVQTFEGPSVRAFTASQKKYFAVCIRPCVPKIKKF